MKIYPTLGSNEWLLQKILDCYVLFFTWNSVFQYFAFKLDYYQNNLWFN